MYQIAGIEFDRRELQDFGLAWLSLSVAFALFIDPAVSLQVITVEYLRETFVPILIRSFATVGTAFLLHELAHKVVAVRFGQIAAFRADYKMLGFAVLSGLAGFLVAAPGAVYHRGRVTKRENGLIAVAGPVTNLGLAVLFLGGFLLFDGAVGALARMGVLINIFLAAFNMVPVGPLDGQTVLDWSRPVFGVVLCVSVLSGVGFVVLFGI